LEINAEYAKTWPNITVKKALHPTQRSGRASRTKSNIFHRIPEKAFDGSGFDLIEKGQ
jgi:hypothetical protein